MALSFNVKSLCTVTGFLKIVQIALALTCIGLLRAHGLHFGSGGSFFDARADNDRFLVGVIAIGSSIIISTPLLLGYVFFDHSSNLLEGLYCLVGATMNISGGAMAIEHYKNTDNDYGLAMGSLMVINALLYLIDGATGTLHNRK
ncbi:protein snakeskin-like [Oratosquilla oratoria]|uniref:protein snakeskin-like n=1 Tax=Oratosquilla oratoria TaxID=337810 RepID=UPI003F7642F2